MAVKIKSDTSELEEIIANFQKFTAQTIPALVKQHSRILAVELANRTQPFSKGKGLGKKALFDGKKAITNDLNKVFRNKETIQGIVDKTRSEGLKQRLQKLLTSGNNEKIGSLFKSVGMINDFQLVAKTGSKDKHKTHRSPNSGRAWNPKKSMFINTAGLIPYTKEVQKRVGLSKSAWADCAKSIGGISGNGTRGIPAFATKGDGQTNGFVIDGTKSRNPFVTMTSKIPWASRILPSEQVTEAQQIVRQKMVNRANVLIKDAAKMNFKPEVTVVYE